MSAAIPRVIFLYDNDALEIRYSDGSRLELSPCGSAMVFHPRIKPGEHPRHYESRQLHKRTQFVTSEHRQKVLQALDFRNRFAKRPYLCTELLQPHDIVSLYASIDYAKWPKLPANAKVDILPDGSRKVTSTDEYASLIVSPHGQDFSVCYLSKLSSERSSHNSTQSLSPPHLPHNSTKPISQDPFGRNRNPKKTSEAIIHPFSHQHRSLTHDEADMHTTSEKLNNMVIAGQAMQAGTERNSNNNGNSFQPQSNPIPCPEPHGLTSLRQDDFSQIAHSQPSLEVKDAKRSCVQSLEGESNQQLGFIVQSPPDENPNSVSWPSELNTNHQHASQALSNQFPSDSHHTQTPVPAVQIHAKASQPFRQAKSTWQSSPNIDGNAGSDRVEERPDIHDIWGSSVPHEISSISRSSTPDGLRMTIDSDTTLAHDTSDNGPVRYRQRHSSPTHQSPTDDDDVQLPFAKLVELKSSLVAHGSFAGIPLANEKDFSWDSDSRGAFSKSLTPTKQTAVFVSGEDFLSGEPKLSTGKDNCDSSFQGSSNCNAQLSNPSISRHSHQDVDETLTPRSQLVCQPGGGGEPHGNVLESPYENSGEKQKIVSVPRHLQNEIPKGEGTKQSCDNQTVASNVVSNRQGSCEVSQRGSHYVQGNQLGGYETPDFGKKDGAAVKSSCNQTGSSYLDEGGQSQRESTSKVKYVWTTSHASRNNCPKEWTHPLMLALQGNAMPLEVTDRNKRQCHTTSLPQALPLTCPFQHTHKITSTRPLSSNDEDQTECDTSSMAVFQRGRLKVVLSEGIVYRLISAPGMTSIEIYPGDGSVLMSQGVKALFFNHFIPGEGQLEERMYSLKSLPPRCSKSFRPIEKMLKTANRFLHLCLSWDKRAGKVTPPCWQREMIAVVEPLSSSVLEECAIDGLGKFSAYSNGRVRVVFDNRTSLNMIADFSARFGTSAKMCHGGGDHESVRLLLPSGNYVTVDKTSHGPYSQYVRVANEWVSWVNTPPSKRSEFYAQRMEPAFVEQAAKLELKKINCFNYILDNTFQPIQQASPSDNPTWLPSSSATQTSPPSSLPHSGLNVVSLTSTVSPKSQHVNYASMARWTSDRSATVDTATGFMSVRQALAQTSSMISDIENFLDENKS